jgi:hypothetical protein
MTASANLLGDASFESGVITYGSTWPAPADGQWYYHPGFGAPTTSTDVAYDGTRSLMLIGQFAVTAQTVNVQANTDYDVSFYVRNDASGDLWPGAVGANGIDYGVYSDSAGEYLFYGSTNQALGSWTKITGSFNSGSATNVRLALNSFITHPMTWVAYDSASITEHSVPEPGSLCLLVSGGLAVLGLRKRIKAWN